MRVLVTGGAGYIGSVVTEQLLGDGHDQSHPSLAEPCVGPRRPGAPGEGEKAERLTLRNGEADVLDGGQQPTAGGEPGGELLDAQDRIGRFHQTADRKYSPITPTPWCGASARPFGAGV